MLSMEDVNFVNNLKVDYYLNVDKKSSKQNYKNNFNIIYLNIQSLRNKLYEVENLIESFGCDIHIIVLAEIWLLASENKFFNIQGYKPYFSNRNEPYGGVAIFVKEEISSCLLFCEELEKSNILGVRLLKQNINILGIYRAHETGINSFIEKIDELTYKYRRSIIVGDININLLNTSNTVIKTYSNMLVSNGFLIYNKISENFATRFGSQTKTIIDHFITDIIENKYHIHILDTCLSDHQMMFTSIEQKPVTESILQFKRVLNYNNMSNDNIWINLNSFNEFDETLEALSLLIKNNTQIICTKNSKKKNNWITTEILKEMKIRDSFFKYKKKYPEDIHTSNLYYKYRDRVKELITEAKKKYYSDEISRSPGDSKKLWNLYKKIIYNTNKIPEDQIKVLCQNDKKLTQEKDIVECLNSYFVNVTSEIEIPTESIDVEYINQFRRNIFTNFNLTPTNYEEVDAAINSLNTTAANGFDNISTKFIKQFSIHLIPIIVKYINKAFETSIFPSKLKTAIVIPIFKKGNSTDCSNYRPISILPSFSKIFEIIIKNRLNLFLTNNKILSEEQFGFEKGSNTTAACLALTDFISKNIDQGKYVGCVFLDLQKAFDCVDHKILLLKLSNLNFSRSCIKFFESYLQDRKQMVRLNNTFSSEKINLKGVPQGSILGPDLFKIYIDDITQLNLKGDIQLYADDTVLKYAESNEENLKNSIQTDMQKIQIWLNKHRLNLNIKKTKIIIFENKSLSMNTNFPYKNQHIEVVKNYNYLGLNLDSKLNWSYHIDSIIKNIAPYIFILRKLRYYLSKNVLYIIYSSYIKSHITYLNPIWSRAPKTYLNKIDIMHKKCIKVIHKYPLLFPTNLLYSDKYLSFTSICRFELYMVAFKIINNKIKHNFILSRNIELHNHNTRNKTNFYLTLFKTNNRANNCLYNSLKAYNELPESLKLISNLSVFKKKIKEYITIANN